MEPGLERKRARWGGRKTTEKGKRVNREEYEEYLKRCCNHTHKKYSLAHETSEI